MVASVKIVDNSAEIIQDLKLFQKRIKPLIKQTLAFVSQVEIRRIKTRTRSGIDAFEKPFEPYRTSAGKNKVSDKVDLTDTGQMFGSLTFKATASKGELFFRGREQVLKASFHDLFGAGKGKVVRPFFRISKRDEKVIVKKFEDNIGKLINEL